MALGTGALGINGATGKSARRTGIALRGAMVFASYLGDFDVDAETNRGLNAVLEMTRAALGLANVLRTESFAGKSSNLPAPVSGIPTVYVKAH
jgi:hypothetical protein